MFRHVSVVKESSPFPLVPQVVQLEKVRFLRLCVKTVLSVLAYSRMVMVFYSLIQKLQSV